jgi:hypothetical protein
MEDEEGQALLYSKVAIVNIVPYTWNMVGVDLKSFQNNNKKEMLIMWGDDVIFFDYSDHFTIYRSIKISGQKH